MKTIKILIGIFFCVLISPLLTGCNNDKICGSWNIKEYVAIFDNNEIVLTKEECKNLKIIEGDPNLLTKDQKANNYIKNISSYYNDVVFNFNKDWTLQTKEKNSDKINSLQWYRDGNFIIAESPDKKDEMALEFKFDNTIENKLVLTINYEGISYQLVFIKLQ